MRIAALRRQLMEDRDAGLREYSQARPLCLAQAHEQGDWERLGELVAMDLMVCRALWLEGEHGPLSDQLSSALSLRHAHRYDNPLTEQIYSALSWVCEDVDRLRAESARQRAEEAASQGRALGKGGSLERATATLLLGRAWAYCLLELHPEHHTQLATLESHLGDSWRNRDQLDLSLSAYDRALGLGLEHDPELLGCLHNNRGLTLRRLGRAEEAVEAFVIAIATWERAGRSDSAWLSHLAAAEGNLGIAYADLGDGHRALSRQRRTLALAEEVHRLEPSPESLANLATCLTHLGNALRQQGLKEDALRACRRARDLLGQDEGSDEDGEARLRRATLELNLGNALCDCERPVEAVECYLKSVRILHLLRIEGHPGVERPLSMTLGNMSVSLQALGEHEQAMNCQRHALEILEEAGLRREEGYHKGIALANLARLYHDRGRVKEWEETYRLARRVLRDSLPTFPAGAVCLADMETLAALVFSRRGRAEAAREALQAAIELYDAQISELGRLDLRRERAHCVQSLGLSLLEGRDFAAAEVALTRACQLWYTLEERGKEGESREALGEALLGQERYEQASLELSEARRLLQSLPPSAERTLAMARRSISLAQADETLRSPQLIAADMRATLAELRELQEAGFCVGRELTDAFTELGKALLAGGQRPAADQAFLAAHAALVGVSSEAERSDDDRIVLAFLGVRRSRILEDDQLKSHLLLDSLRRLEPSLLSGKGNRVAVYCLVALERGWGQRAGPEMRQAVWRCLLVIGLFDRRTLLRLSQPPARLCGPALGEFLEAFRALEERAPPLPRLFTTAEAAAELPRLGGQALDLSARIDEVCQRLCQDALRPGELPAALPGLVGQVWRLRAEGAVARELRRGRIELACMVDADTAYLRWEQGQSQARYRLANEETLRDL